MTRRFRILLLVVLLVQVVAVPFGRCRAIFHAPEAAENPASVVAAHYQKHAHHEHFHGPAFPGAHEHDSDTPDHSHVREQDILQRDCRDRLLDQPDLAPSNLLWIETSHSYLRQAAAAFGGVRDPGAHSPASLPLAGRTSILLL